jgi:hypothetical protein
MPLRHTCFYAASGKLQFAAVESPACSIRAAELLARQTNPNKFHRTERLLVYAAPNYPLYERLVAEHIEACSRYVTLI